MPPESFAVEAWVYLAINTVLVYNRFWGRWKTRGFRGLAPDDYLMIMSILLYTAATAMAYRVAAHWHGLSNSGMTDAEREALDPSSHEYHLRVKGSQSQLIGWTIYVVLLWTLKVCWLFFYKRLGDGVDNMTLKINIGFGLIAVTLLGTLLTILGCYPLKKWWQIYPDPGNFCQPATSRLQAYTLIATNISTDLYIMSLPLPMVWNARIPICQKLILVAMFCGGLLTAVFGGLRCGFILQDRAQSPELAGAWSIRECFVAVFITNIPAMLPMIHRVLRRISDFKSNPGDSGLGPESKEGGKVPLFRMGTLSGKPRDKKKFNHPLSLPGETFYELNGSEEEMIENSKPVPTSKEGLPAGSDITVTTEWQVQCTTMNSEERQQELHQTVNGFQARQSRHS